MHHADNYYMDDFTLLNVILIVVICAVIFMHRLITAFFATSCTPHFVAWSTGSRTGESEITVQYGFSYFRHFLFEMTEN